LPRGSGADDSEASGSEDQGTEEQGTSEETTFSSEVAVLDCDASTSELDDSSVILGQAIATGEHLQRIVLMTDTQKAQLQDMLSKIEEVRKALEYANAKM
jgi:hypothetical protein